MTAYKSTAARQVEIASRAFALQQRVRELEKFARAAIAELMKLRNFEQLDAATQEHLVAIEELLVAGLAEGMKPKPAKPAELPDEPWALNVAPRYTPGSPALVSRRTGEQVAKEERDAYERHLEGLYGDEGIEKARRLGLSRIVYERVRERHGKGGKCTVTWLDTITGERFEELHR